ncbi:MAG: CRISPR-associated helicase Cas3' [Leptolyngbya sp. SIO1E4]|nr:CRISPR-associated helicase Cas3' [Leptolyngbya sp. SIO1E4]
MHSLPTEYLLAKSPKPDRKPITLEQHLHDAGQCAYHIFRLDHRWGRNWCRFFGLTDKIAQETFLLNLRIAALFHDVGKANADFYTAVTAPVFTAQTLRHEHLSALVLCLPEVRSWLFQTKHKQPSNLDVDVITAAVLSHHLKASKKETSIHGKNYRWCQPDSVANNPSVRLYFDHPEVRRILVKIAGLADLDTPPYLPEMPWAQNSLWDKARRDGINYADDLEDDLEDEPDRRRLLVAVKAGLIVADAAASGLVREDHNITDWIGAVVYSEAIAPSEISEKILQRRIEQIETRTKATFKFHAFQEQAAQQGSKALLLVACGGGKTLAAWKWAEQQSREHEIGKVIFLYPTRGTATEGFKDYVGWAPEADAELVTGTAKYELEAMAENPSESTDQKVYRSEATERLYALGFWSKRFFSATVDQFLGFMEHSYQSLCLLPVLADSAVIIDEVHSFDQSMFDTLINFLQTFHIPVLCMTATLPKSRRKQLVDLGLKVFPTQADRESEALSDLKVKEQTNRYRLKPVANFEEALGKAVAAYREGLRVLWVVNIVDRCLAIAHKLEQKFQELNVDADVLTYHSRFRLCDRQTVHTRTVNAFSFSEEKAPKAAIAVTTQVCEMSLDLDADVLITEIAPVSALVQRFGRANRHLKRAFAWLHPYMPPGSRPYQQEDLIQAGEFLDSFNTELINQRQLATALEEFSRSERRAGDFSPFLNSGYFAIPGAFRDIEEYAVPCILDSDFDTVRPLIEARKPYDGYQLNTPHKWVKDWLADEGNIRPNWLPKYLSVVSGHPERYRKDRGFINKSAEEVNLG